MICYISNCSLILYHYTKIRKPLYIRLTADDILGTIEHEYVGAEIASAGAVASYCAKPDISNGTIDGLYVIERLEALIDAIGVFLCVIVGDLVCEEVMLIIGVCTDAIIGSGIGIGVGFNVCTNIGVCVLMFVQIIDIL